ncbi:MAG: hypothetical protein JWQ10_2008 [Herbaspirillum sp.]|nr:hypothetical protein [Herbaspirillum sp.]
MTIALYDASALSYLQTLGAVSGFLEKGLAFCQENNIDPETVVETRVFPDMRPFRYQIQAVAHHSAHAIEAIKSGIFRAPGERPAHNYAELQALIAEAREAVEKVTPEDINSRENADVVFQADPKRIFTTEAFVMTFSLPNVHFHAATAYGILRAKGVPVGKRDFMGILRLKA